LGNNGIEAETDVFSTIAAAAKALTVRIVSRIRQRLDRTHLVVAACPGRYECKASEYRPTPRMSGPLCLPWIAHRGRAAWPLNTLGSAHRRATAHAMRGSSGATARLRPAGITSWPLLDFDLQQTVNFGNSTW